MSRLDNLKNAIGDISTRFGHLNDIVQNGTTDQAKDYSFTAALLISFK
jgi:putative membrane protein